MSEPCPPAFIRTAPPIVPGTPTAHSKPVRPAAAVRRATTGSGAAPPARTRVPAISTSRYRPARVMASPSKPSSATSRFDPLPITSTSMPVSRTAAVTAAMSPSSSTVTKRAAGPPTR